MSFAQKLAQPGVVCGWGFDSPAKLNDFGVATDHPITYCWAPGNGDPVCELANPGGMGNGVINYARAAGERLCLAYGGTPDGICHYPQVDNAVYYAAGGGTGSLKFDIPSQSGAGTGGYIWLPFQGLGTSFYIGPDHPNGGIVYMQWRERVDQAFIDMLNMGSNALNTGAFKELILFGNPPGGDDSSLFEITPAIRVSARLFSCSAQQGQQPFETAAGSCLSGLALQQGPPICCYPGSVSDPNCAVLQANHWYEITLRGELRPVASDFTVSGNRLLRPNTFSGGMASDQRAVYIVGEGAGKFYKIMTFNNAGDVTLSTTPAVQGSNKSVYIANSLNTRIQTWVDARPVMDFPDAKVFWGPHAGGIGQGNGWGSVKIQRHATNKNPSVAHSEAHSWVDDLIVSTQPIAMGSTPPPNTAGKIIITV